MIFMPTGKAQIGQCIPPRSPATLSMKLLITLACYRNWEVGCGRAPRLLLPSSKPTVGK